MSEPTSDDGLDHAEIVGDAALGDAESLDYEAALAQDPEMASMMERVRQMEAEAEQLKAVQSELERSIIPNASGASGSGTGSSGTAGGVAGVSGESAEGMAGPVLVKRGSTDAGGASGADGGAGSSSLDEREELDKRSIFVGNVDYGASAEELATHFHGCGAVNRVTILTDKFTKSPKGFAYVEFTDVAAVTTAMALDESLFRGRAIKVMPKRTNLPGHSARARGRGLRGGRGGAAAMYMPMPYYPMPMFAPPRFGAPIFRGGRTRRRAFFSPY